MMPFFLTLDPAMPDLPSLPPVICNRQNNRRSYSVCTYRSITRNGRQARVNLEQIATIYSPDGLGELVFNASFLEANPEFARISVTRSGPGAAGLHYAWKEDPELTAAADSLRSAGLRLKLCPLTDGRPHPLVILCPGGGYAFVSIPNEGEAVAAALNRAGIHAAILTYTTNRPELGDLPAQELCRCVCALGTMALTFKFSTLNVMGFSAGAHVCALYSALWHTPRLGMAPDQRELCRPDGCVLSYPVICSGQYAHQGSFDFLCSDQAQQERWSVDKLVSPAMPRTFIWHTLNDKTVPVENTLIMMRALKENGVSFEAHIFPDGVHGMALGTPESAVRPECVNPHAAAWFPLCTQWLQAAV